MRHIVFWALVLQATYKCTGANAAQAVKRETPCFSFELSKETASAYLAGSQSVSDKLVERGIVDARCLDENGIFDPDIGGDDFDCQN